MKKSTRIVKKLLALFLVVLMSINTLGAVVSDNDGSAFITKAEFDSLKNNFQSQIDQYNTSIDSKIDGAIASYLAGINVTKKSKIKPLIKDSFDYLEMMGSDNIFPLTENRPYGTIITNLIALGKPTTSLTEAAATLATTWTSSNIYYSDRVLATINGKKFYNLHGVSAACYFDKILTGIMAIANARILNIQNAVMAVNYGAGGDSMNTTMLTNLTAARTGAAIPARALIIYKDDWEDKDDAHGNNNGTIDRDHVHQIALYPDDANNTSTYEHTWPYFASKPSGASQLITPHIQVAAYTPIAATDDKDVQIYGMWGPSQVQLVENIKWIINPDDEDMTLYGYVNHAFTKPTLVYDKNPAVPKISALITDEVTKSNLDWRPNTIRRVFLPHPDPANPSRGLIDVWDYQSSFPDGDTSPSTWSYSTNWNIQGPFAKYDMASYLFDVGYDQTKLCYFDADIFKTIPTSKLDNYLQNKQSRYGFPMFEIEKEGKLEIKPEFSDTSKEYKIWLTKGPSDATEMTNKPTNVYTPIGLTQNADGSATISSGDAIKIEVEKDDIVYMSWTIKDKVGGGKLKYPLEAIIETE